MKEIELIETVATYDELYQDIDLNTLCNKVYCDYKNSSEERKITSK